MEKPSKERQQEILRLINKALEYQFESYSWSHMLRDIPDLTKKECRWAEQNTGYQAYICE